ncbi:MAG: ferrous iron transport protein A [Leptolyngbyaceae cyanobacterium]
MDPTVVNTNSGKRFEAHQLGPITFIGGNADLDGPSVPQQDTPYRSTSSKSFPPSGSHLPLAMAAVGDRLCIVQFKGSHRMARRLTDVGLVLGGEVTVISRTESGSVIVALAGCRIGLGAGIAHRVLVIAATEAIVQMMTHPSKTPSVTGESAMPATLHLGALAVGQSGCVVGYAQGSRAYREKLLSMGLTPGTRFTLTRQAPMGDPVEIELRGFKLSLRKDEAAAIRVETVASDITSGEVGHD